MALKKGDFLTGILGSVVLKVVNGRQVVSSRPIKGTMKQTDATKISSNTFGMASAFAAVFRKTIGRNLNYLYDNQMCSRLNGEFYSVLKDCRDNKTMKYTFDEDSFSKLSGFDFNINSKVKNRLSKLPEITLEQDNLSVVFETMSIPVMFSFPYQSFNCHLSVSVSLFRLQDGLVAANAITQGITITKDKDALNAFEFKFIIPDGCFYIVCLYLEYATADKNGWKMINSKKFSPAFICKASIAPGMYGNNDNYQWEQMLKFN